MKQGIETSFSSSVATGPKFSRVLHAGVWPKCEKCGASLYFSKLCGACGHWNR